MTVKQQQCLLCYLGFYSGLIDGKAGAATKAAAAKF
jgi:peptidoglycan hydrolase-like protein with peptidoglycan-binding domain